MNSILEKNGFLVLRNVFKKEDLIHILEEINLTVKQKYRKRDINLVKGRINTFHALKKNKKILNFAMKNIIPISDQILKEKSKIKGIEYFAKPPKIGMASPPHQDNFYWCLKKPKGANFWIAIDHASKKNGGLYYFKGSQKLGLLKHKNSNIPGSSQTVLNLPSKKNYRKEFIDLNPGDVIVHHLEVVHGSEANKSSSSRRGLVINTISENAKIDKIKKKNYLKNLNLQIKSREKKSARI